jgi:hypothetical protein
MNPPLNHPIGDNALETRDDLQRALLALFAPLKPYFSTGGARVEFGFTGAHFDDVAASLEGFARPLWGIVPLSAGGGDYTDWGRYRDGLINGTDPHHPEYWGTPNDYDQRLVEMAAIGLALCLASDHIWTPLTPAQQTNLARWLNFINQKSVVKSNWLWFRVLVNMGLSHVGAQYDNEQITADLDQIDAFYLGGGWYSDGHNQQRDYYIPFAMHYYALIYAKLWGDKDPQRANTYRQRATEFAQDFIHWFASDGSALPFGRSLTYRFAQGGFWGALAFADVEAFDWGIIKGLALRHLRWWLEQPIFAPDGTLSIGYRYPNLNMAEQYNSPRSPYWALKFFLPLALPASHPFWQAEEKPLPPSATVNQQPHPYMILTKDQASHHTIALTSGQSEPWIRHADAKYAKFAYSTALGNYSLTQLAPDSMLAISDDGQHYRVRERAFDIRFEHGAIFGRWESMRGVMVETWLIPCPDSPHWHIRAHRVVTDRPIWTSEGGFAIDRTGDDVITKAGIQSVSIGSASAEYPAGGSGIHDLLGQRDGQILRLDPNTNLNAPRTVLPTLSAEYPAGEHWLICAVLADPDGVYWAREWANKPTIPDFIHQKMAV